jgi:hypothetical protein
VATRSPVTTGVMEQPLCSVRKPSV